MSESVKAVELKPVKADAELMSAWLGGMEDVTISPKLLFDLQTLLRYYADFIVPNEKVSIDYAYEGCPCASVDKNQIFIPLDMLQEGRVDETIAAVIHELHHIKFSDGETKICGNILPYMERILNTVEVTHHGQEVSIWDALESHGKIIGDEIITRECRHSYKQFIYKFFGDMFLMLNAIEDIRIDEKQPENLKKYRYKQEGLAFEKFKERVAEGTIDTDTLFGRFLIALFHYKGLMKSPFFQKSELTKRKICGAKKHNSYFPITFKTFAETIQDHAGALWKQFDEQMDFSDSAISDFLMDELAESKDGNADSGIGGDEELGLEPKKASDCGSIDEKFSKEVEVAFGESSFEDLLTAMTPDQKIGGELSAEPKVVLSESAWAEIESFKRITHVPCREPIVEAEQGIAFDTLIFDCYA